MIEAFYGQEHFKHNPTAEIFDGEKDPYLDVPDRISTIILALKEFGKARVNPSTKQSESHILAVHSKEYVDFIKSVSSAAIEGKWRYPATFPYGYKNNRPKSEDALLGYYTYDLAAPIGAGTYEAAKSSADAVVCASNNLMQTADVTYALCRPPGHHAESQRMGGYCYFNNAAIAAEMLSHAGPVAILDLDVHHFNGTQAIFYDRSDVFTVSIHADPREGYPYFSGATSEIGIDSGEGYNLNFPLPMGTSNTIYDKALKRSLLEIRARKSEYLVVSFGLDTYKADPVGYFKLTSDYYENMGSQINDIALPTLIVQEGGYNLETLGKNVVGFLKGFKRDHIYTFS